LSDLNFKLYCKIRKEISDIIGSAGQPKKASAALTMNKKINIEKDKP